MKKKPSNHNHEYLDEALEKAESELSETYESDEIPPVDIVAFNELRSCADLFRLYCASQLKIMPDYQRDVVWPPSAQTRFIDSLVKQLPIPSMCISLDYKTDMRQVVDGLQRMSVIVKFFSDMNWRLSNIDDIDKRIANKTVEFISRQHPEIYRRIENTTLPVTVLRCDLSKRTHEEYIFTIFHRLNTGGLKLTNQEIRNCIYSGPFNKLLKDIVNSDLFVNAFSIKENRRYRQSNEELVLRILSFAANFMQYKGPLSKHLNVFMSKHRRAGETILSELKDQFISALELLYKRILGEEPLPRMSKATTEAIIVGIILNFDTLVEKSDDVLQKKYEELRSDGLFSLEALKEGLAARDRVVARFTRAKEIFH